MEHAPKIIVISGPTASGKSALALQLAAVLDGEIVNADSVQVYKDFDIGTSKPSVEELASVPHHLVSEILPTADFNVGIFFFFFYEHIRDIVARSKVPIIVGGTGLYIQSLLCGLAEIKQIKDSAKATLDTKEEAIRKEVDSEDDFRLMLFRWLCEIDSLAGEKLNWRDVARVKRAILVKLSTGQSIVEFQLSHQQNANNHNVKKYCALVLVRLPLRAELYQAINSRVEEMLRLGLVEEVEQLKTKYNLECRPFEAIGYRQVIDFLVNGNIDYSQMVEDIQRDTRRYAKRQYTWWANQPRKLGWKLWDVNSKLVEGEFAKPDFSSPDGNKNSSIVSAVKNFLSDVSYAASSSVNHSADCAEIKQKEIYYLPIS